MAINLSNIISLSETVEVKAETNGTTAYGVYAIAKEVFATLGLDFVNSKGGELKSQAFYNYAKNGKINGNKNSAQRYTDEEVENFVARMIATAKARQA